jgi:conjugal transfer mating pair stabilization protein TraN
MHRFLMFFMMILFFQNTYAEDIQSIVNQTLAQSESLKNDSYNHIKNFNPNSTFDHYSSNPSQTQYYGGVTQSDTTKLNQDAMNAPLSTDAGSTVSSSVSNHPKFVISNNDADISHSQFIQRDADNIVHGVTDRYVDCKSTQICNTTYSQKTCEEEPENIYQSCKKTLNIDIIPHETTTHYTLVVHVKTKDHKYAGIDVNAVTGEINFVGPHDTSFRLDGRLPGNLNCNGLQGSVTQFNSNNRDTHLDNISFPNCSNGMALDFHLSGSKTINLDMQIDVISKVITFEVKDRWVENCDGLLHEPSCLFKSKICNQPSSTRTFQGIPVTRDCWEENYSYICHGGSGSGTCKALQAEGCEQINSLCKNKKDNECALYQQTYQCPVQACSSTANVSCGDGKNYCLDGSCVDHSYQKSKDFANGVSALSAVSDASKQLDPSSLTIFAGHPTECSEIPVGFSNCCTEKGWGQDAGLAHCSMEAKKLHEAREQGVVVKIGRYCSGSDPFPCLEHSQVFCVFNSKLARIIQQQGRVGQLGMNFGSAKNPNCLGITPDQLRSIDLGKIDFQDFYADINAKKPDIKQIQQKIDQHVQQFQDAGQING